MKKPRYSQQHGFSLTELVLSLGIASFCLLTIVGAFPIGLQNVQQSNRQDEMVNLESKVIQDIASTPQTASTSNSPLFGLCVPPSGGTPNIDIPQSVYIDGCGVPTSGPQDPTSIYRVSVGFGPPASGLKSATTVRVMITFPALGDTTAGWPTNYATIVQTMAAINRN
jgi:uncharacterized protein (TIGR02598 family)